MISFLKSIELVVLSIVLVSLMLKAPTQVTLLFEIETKVGISIISISGFIELVVLPIILVSSILEILTLISLLFEVRTKTDDIDTEVEIKNNVESETGNISSYVVGTKVIMGFREKFSNGVDDISFSILGTKVTVELWIEDSVDVRGRRKGYIARGSI